MRTVQELQPGVVRAGSGQMDAMSQMIRTRLDTRHNPKNVVTERATAKTTRIQRVHPNRTRTLLVPLTRSPNPFIFSRLRGATVEAEKMFDHFLAFAFIPLRNCWEFFGSLRPLRPPAALHAKGPG